MKRFAALFLSLALILAGCGGAGGSGGSGGSGGDQSNGAKKLRVGMVTDVTGLSGSQENKSFQDLAWDGLKQAEAELGAEVTVIESREVVDLVPNLRKLADQNYDLIVGVGFLFTDAINEVAQQYPNKSFAIIDSVVDQPNVASYVFMEEEGSFLAGALAAGLSGLKTDRIGGQKVIGFVGGISAPLIHKFEAGYAAGAKTIDPEVKVLSAYAETFDDPGKGKELTLSMHQKGADIVYHAAGNTGLGTIQAAKEENFWAIGVNLDQHPVAPGSVVASMTKGVGTATFEASKAVGNGSFKAGVHVLDTKAGGVDLIGLDHNEGAIPAELLTKIEKLREMIIKGEIKVPSTLEDAASFTPPTGF